jgi:CcmD family protein
MRSLILFAAAFLFLVAGPAAASSQEAAPPPEQAAVTIGQTAEVGAGTVMQPASGLPERTPQARTMRAYWHVFIAFAATWLLLFGYALTMGRRFGRLEQEVQRIRGGT